MDAAVAALCLRCNDLKEAMARIDAEKLGASPESRRALDELISVEGHLAVFLADLQRHYTEPTHRPATHRRE